VNKTQLFQEIDRILAIKSACPLLAFSVKVLKWQEPDKQSSVARVDLSFPFSNEQRDHRCTISCLFRENGVCTLSMNTQPAPDFIFDPDIRRIMDGTDVSDQAARPHTWEHGIMSLLERIDHYRQAVVKNCCRLDGHFHQAYKHLNA